MPESVSTVDEILDGLRAWPKGHDESLLDAAVAAVLAAADARTAEIVAVIRSGEAAAMGWHSFAVYLARRFPNEGTHAPHGDRPAHERGGRA